VRIAVLTLAALAATGCMGRSESSSGQPGRTELEISISPEGKDGPTKVWTLKCPDGGTLPDPEGACARLEALDDPFAPVPKNVACTMIYGGPHIAAVRGTFRGEPVDATFNRVNGCEIERWNKLRFLFEAG
jgi:hypothetical protein